MQNTNANLLEVPSGSLKPGMYVAGLDRPWLETPFSVQGFYIRSQQDAQFVAEHCLFVYVDPRRYRNNPGAGVAKTRGYKTKTSLKKEFSKASVELESTNDAIRRVFDRLRAGHKLDLLAVQRAIDPLLDSVLRNGEALAALIRIKAKGDYLFNHSVANAVWAAVLGRQLALDREQLKRLSLGAALVDVGMTRLPDELMASAAPLQPAETERVRTHVAAGLELLNAGEPVHEDVLTTLRCHHERFDGSGYPDGIAGTSIPLFARIVGLVDSYDAMITERPHAPARSSFEAVQELTDLNRSLFQSELVEQFVQAIGLFPTGSVVELSTGEIAVVIAQNPSRRLRPRVVIILDENKRPHNKSVVVDLCRYGDEQRSSDLWITCEHEPGAFGIRADEFFL